MVLEQREMAAQRSADCDCRWGGAEEAGGWAPVRKPQGLSSQRKLRQSHEGGGEALHASEHP